MVIVISRHGCTASRVHQPQPRSSMRHSLRPARLVPALFKKITNHLSPLSLLEVDQGVKMVKYFLGSMELVLVQLLSQDCLCLLDKLDVAAGTARSLRSRGMPQTSGSPMYGIFNATIATSSLLFARAEVAQIRLKTCSIRHQYLKSISICRRIISWAYAWPPTSSPG